jgi:hypothetical protein
MRPQILPSISPIILKGEVKIKTNLVLKKKKIIQVFGDGTFQILKKMGDKIEESFLLTQSFEIKMLRADKFQMRYKSLSKKIYCKDVTQWVDVLNVRKL